MPVRAQTHQPGRTIQWQEEYRDAQSPDKRDYSSSFERIMSFDHNINSDTASELPVYYELIFARNYYPDHIVKLSEMQFRPLDDTELSAVNNISQLNTEIITNQSWVKSRGEPAIQITFIPVRRNPATGTPEKLVSFSYSFEEQDTKTPTATKSHSYAESSVLSSGNWIKIKTTKDGIYKLTYDDLVQMGIESPSGIRILGNGNRMLPKMNNIPRHDDLVENKIYINRGKDGIFGPGDYLLFYGQGPVSWNYNESSGMFEHERHLYSDGSYYFITDSPSGNNLIELSETPDQQPDIIIEEFIDYDFHEDEMVNLLNSGRTWFGEHFRMITSYDFSFSFPYIEAGQEARLKWGTAARSPVASSFSMIYNSGEISRLDISPVNMGSIVTNYANAREETAIFNPAGDNIALSIIFEQNTPSAEGWLDYILLNVKRSLVMEGSQMQFRGPEVPVEGQVAEFRIRNFTNATRIWNITNPLDISEISTQVSGNTMTFKDHVGQLQQYIAFNEDNFLQPDILGKIPNQNLHGIRSADMVIVTHPLFMTEALRLADHRRNNDGLEVEVLTPEQIYNEFSSGKPDITAIRDFMKMLYDRASSESEIPKYLLLFGKGAFDNRPGDPSKTNFVPTYQSPNSLRPTQSFVSDDFFALLDDDEGEYSGLVDTGTGRLPVTTRGQAEAVVNKIINYNTQQKKGDWQNVLCFIADDGDNNIHMRDADILAEGISENKPVFNIEKIYLDAWPKKGTSSGQRYPEVNNAISERIRKGSLIMNYTGHGNELKLADENILDINDVLSYTNMDRLPVFMTATCEFSRFDNPDRVSAGEMLLLNPAGGGIALFSTTRLVYATPNFLLNQNFYRFVLERSYNGEDMRLGDIMRLTKIHSSSGINKRNFTLLGDPSMKLALPEYRALITSINGISVSEPADTLKALGKVTVSGEIVNSQGGVLSDFGGLVYHTVYDKINIEETLGNDGSDPFDFESRNNIIYKGKASVTGGEFSFSFIVPKDIAYHYGSGKISSFASYGSNDAAGYYTDFIIGGSDPGAVEDTDGPEIELFMNDANFISGGITDQNPRLLAYLSDSSGINTVGSGIGHDITLIKNNDPSTLIVLNDYYVAETDSYQGGTVEYPFSNLDEGNYELSLKAWDVFNNSSETSLKFTVSESAKLALSHVFNYPNPFTRNTAFHFEHNQPGMGIDVLIQVFTISGRLVKTIDTSINTPGFKPDPVYWDGLDDYGDKIGRGVYIYRIRLRSENGQIAEKYEKLVILK